MKKALLLFCFVLAGGLAVSGASEPNAIRDKLGRDTTLQSFPCARGDVWFYPDGALDQCTLSRSATVGDLRIPRGSVIELWPDGGARYLVLRRAGLLAGYRVRGGTRLALVRGATTAFYRTGELRSFYLMENQAIQGVPCRGGAWNTFADPNGSENQVELYPKGSLESCTLSRGYDNFPGGRRVVLAEPGNNTEVAKTAAAQ